MKWVGEREVFSRFRVSGQKQKETPAQERQAWKERQEKHLADRSRLQEVALLIVQQTQAASALELTSEEVPILAEHIAFNLARDPWNKKHGLSRSYELNLRAFEAFPIHWENLYPPALDPEIITALRSFSYAGKNIAEHALSHIQKKKQFAPALQDFLDGEPAAQGKMQTLLLDVPPLNTSADPDNPIRHFYINKREIHKHRVAGLADLLHQAGKSPS